MKLGTKAPRHQRVEGQDSHRPLIEAQRAAHARVDHARRRIGDQSVPGIGPRIIVGKGQGTGVIEQSRQPRLLSRQHRRIEGRRQQTRGQQNLRGLRQVLERAGLSLDQMDVIELNEAFASQALAVLRDLGLPDDAEHVNPNGGAIALGHPLGMSGARLITTAMYELHRRGGRYALCTMCIGVGQGIATIIERV